MITQITAALSICMYSRLYTFLFTWRSSFLIFLPKYYTEVGKKRWITYFQSCHFLYCSFFSLQWADIALEIKTKFLALIQWPWIIWCFPVSFYFISNSFFVASFTIILPCFAILRQTNPFVVLYSCCLGAFPV